MTTPRYEDAQWKNSMRLRFDYNNMMAGSIDPEAQAPKFRRQIGAITPEDLHRLQPQIDKARRSLGNKWGKPSRMLAWTKLPYMSATVIEDILTTARRIRSGFDTFVVLGIGGSALGPMAVQQALNHIHYNQLDAPRRGGPRLFIEDNIDPERMSALLDVVDLEKTCFNVITKSGSTSETMSQFMIIYNLLSQRLGADAAARHIIATTDRRKGYLIKIAAQLKLKTFVIPDGVGGRFSELSAVGLLAAAVCGIDIKELLAGAAYMDQLCHNEDITANPGWMAGVLGYLTMSEKKKNIQIMMPYSDALKYMADWYSQLWAESLGKRETLRGKVVHVGQTPVKSLGVTDQHSQVQLYTEGPFDKYVTFLAVEDFRSTVGIPSVFTDIPAVAFLGGHTLNELINTERVATEYALAKAGKLSQTITMPQINAFTVGQLLYFFMVQTAVAGELLGVDAFNQPGVEEGKNATYALMNRPGYEQKRVELSAKPNKLAQYII